jgi:putative acetyltransferase
VKIRPARPEDSEAMYAVYTTSVRTLAKDHHTPAQIEVWVGGLTPQTFARSVDGQLLLVAEEIDGHIVGYAHLDVPRGGVEAIYVHPDYARKRIGSQLLEAMEEVARQAGITELNLDASPNAVPFYAQAGFRAEQWITPRMNGVELSCLSMRKTLGEPIPLRG